MRKEFGKKDGIRITYPADNGCFEDMKTAESILIANDGTILCDNFPEERTSHGFTRSIIRWNFPFVRLYQLRLEPDGG